MHKKHHHHHHHHTVSVIIKTSTGITHFLVKCQFLYGMVLVLGYIFNKESKNHFYDPFQLWTWPRSTMTLTHLETCPSSGTGIMVLFGALWIHTVNGGPIPPTVTAFLDKEDSSEQYKSYSNRSLGFICTTNVHNICILSLLKKKIRNTKKYVNKTGMENLKHTWESPFKTAWSTNLRLPSSDEVTPSDQAAQRWCAHTWP